MSAQICIVPLSFQALFVADYPIDVELPPLRCECSGCMKKFKNIYLEWKHPQHLGMCGRLLILHVGLRSSDRISVVRVKIFFFWEGPGEFETWVQCLKECLNLGLSCVSLDPFPDCLPFENWQP